MELAGKSVAASPCGSAFAIQLEADSPPSPLFSRISNRQVVSRVPKDSYAVNPHSVPIHIIVLLSTQRAALSASPRGSVGGYRTLPACLPIFQPGSCAFSRQEHESPPPSSIQATPFHAKDAHSRVDCTVSEPPCPLPSSLPSEARMLAGLWAS